MRTKKLAKSGKYKVFTRVWWKDNPNWPNGLEPEPNGRRTTISKNIENEETARRIAQEWNATHKPGRYSRKAEYTEQ